MNIKNITQMFAGVIFALLLGAGSTLAAVNIKVTDAPYNANAIGVDNANAFYQALTYIVAQGGGTLTVPAGNYKFISQKTIDLQGTSVTIVGDGEGVTCLASANSTGIWLFSNTSSENQLSIYDLTFMASNSGASGTALQIINPSLSTSAIHSLTMEHVDFQATTANVDYFNRRIYTSYLQQPVFVDVFGACSGTAGQPTDGFRIDYGNGATFENCYSKNVDIGFSLTNYQGTVTFSRCLAVGINHGYNVSALTTGTCEVDILDCHNNSYVDGVTVVNANPVNIKNMATYVCDVQTPFTDLIIQNCSNVNITGNVFHQPYDPNRTNIWLQGTTSGVTIKHNVFNTCKGWTHPGGNGPNYPSPYADTVVHLVQDTGVTGVSMVENIDTPKFDL